MIRPGSHILLFALLAVPALAPGQAVYTATRERLQVGAGWSIASPDYSTYDASGIYVFGTAGLYKRLSLEGDIHYDSLVTPSDIGEDTFLIGPRYDVLKQDRFRAYVKAEFGIGRFQYQIGEYRTPSTSVYTALNIGGGFEYRASRHINVRALDIEAQRWPGFAPNGLSPLVTSFGIAYIP
jgi:hypothetical protein